MLTASCTSLLLRATVLPAFQAPVVRATTTQLSAWSAACVSARSLTSTSLAAAKKHRGSSSKQIKRGRGDPHLEEIERDPSGDVQIIDPKDSSKSIGKVGNDKRRGERYDQDVTWQKFKDVISAAENHLSHLTARVKRPDPNIIEKLPAQLHHNRDDTTHKVKELATVGVKGDSYVIHCFDKAYIKAVEKAIYDSDLDLVPTEQPGDEEGTIRIPVQKPTNESRNGLIKDIAQVMESYRRQARDVRKVAMKLVKADIDDGVVGSEEGSLQQKEIDVEVKKATHAIDKLQKDSQESLRQMQVTDDI